MNEHSAFKEEDLSLINEIEKNPALSQRYLSQSLNISLGKANYLLKELIKKGLIRIGVFSRNPGKVKKIQYVLTKKGIEEKVTLTYHFLKVKEKEYKRLRGEYERCLENNHRKRQYKNGA